MRKLLFSSIIGITVVFAGWNYLNVKPLEVVIETDRNLSKDNKVVGRLAKERPNKTGEASVRAEKVLQRPIKEGIPSYEEAPAQALAQLYRISNDPSIAKHFNGGGQSFLEIWEIDLDTNYLLAIEEGGLFSMPDPDGGFHNVNIERSKRRELETPDGKVLRSKTVSGKVIGSNNMSGLSLSIVEIEGKIAISGTYPTDSGIFRVANINGDPSTVYMMKYSDISNRYLQHDVVPGRLR